MKLYLTMSAKEIPSNSDPILNLVSILEREGFKLIQNGARMMALERFLIFEFPAKEQNEN